MRLIKNIVVDGKIELITALHIGAGQENVQIGGIDLPVLRNPQTEKPYIPGSSIRGKLRFLSEWRNQKVDVKSGKEKGKTIYYADPHQCTEKSCSICKVFGSLNHHELRGPTRLLVRDAYLTNEKDFDNATMIEVKWENTIDRISGTAKHPRPIERIVPGTLFDFEFVYRVFDLDDDDGDADKENFNIIIQAMELLENDTLGGSGSRGCGKIVFKDIVIHKGQGLDGEKYDSLPVLLKAGKLL
ncbi:type III-A CRISPR-associated RAMP protein Csm3 [bacterium]|nr:type III-A CRISPR-associated RAMP protein Csm3 [bacterium]